MKVVNTFKPGHKYITVHFYPTLDEMNITGWYYKDTADSCKKDSCYITTIEI